MNPFLIRELQPYTEEDYKIRVRVCRLWRGKRIKPDRNDGLHCVLIDERGDAIHGIVNEANYSSVSGKLKQGEVYMISNFHVRQSQDDFKVLDNSCKLTSMEKQSSYCSTTASHKFHNTDSIYWITVSWKNALIKPIFLQISLVV